MTDQATQTSLTDGTDETVDEPTPKTEAAAVPGPDNEGNQPTEQPVGDDSESSQPPDSAKDAPTSPQAGHQPNPQPNPPAPSSVRSPASGKVGSFEVTTQISTARPVAIPRGSVGYLHRLTYLLAVAAAFGIGPLTSKLGVSAGAALLVMLGVALALAASASLNATAVISGSLGALASGMLTTVSPALAGGVLVALCFAERTTRVPGAGAKLVHLALAAAGGALAGVVCATYQSAEPGVMAISVVVAAVLAALPLFIDADDPRAHALDSLAERVPKPASGLLRRGALLCRTADESVLDRQLLGQVRQSWHKLLQLGEARARLAGATAVGPLWIAEPTTAAVTRTGRRANAQASAVARRLDQQIAQHVDALTRAFTAVDAAQAAELSLDDSALRNVQSSGESLEHVAEAIVDEV